jgi:hypothetical protein
MPWLETDVRDQRIRFVIAANHPDTTSVSRISATDEAAMRAAPSRARLRSA